ncbi:MAG: HK97 family phage prohead protease [Candidatus Thiodiazotropha sp. (ex Epidulcina cf. delphinae)]|nr:HK97 family phage prohead protease [Candidatus Thiodiazotropha sp. (ex Epidulcina cf. delphinae)]
MMTQTRDLPLRVKSVDETGKFTGYGSVYGVEDSYGDVVVKGAFKNSLEDWASKGRLPAMLWQHRTDDPIGVYENMFEDDDGLYVEGQLLIHDDPLAKRAYGHLKAGSISGLSIGYNLSDSGWEYDKDKDIFILSEIDLWEVSLVTFPANDAARVQDVKRTCKAGGVPEKVLVERLLRDAGFSRRQAKAFIAEGYGAIDPRDAEKCAEDLQNLINSIRS